MMRIGQPLSQAQAIAGGVFREWNEELGERIAADAVGVGLRRVVAAAGQNERWPRLGHLFHDWNFAHPLFGFDKLAASVVKFLGRFARFIIDCGEEESS